MKIKLEKIKTNNKFHWENSGFVESWFVKKIWWTLYRSIVVPIIFAVIVILGIVGNILVLVVVLVKHQMRNTTNVLIVVSTIHNSWQYWLLNFQTGGTKWEKNLLRINKGNYQILKIGLMGRHCSVKNWASF